MALEFNLSIQTFSEFMAATNVPHHTLDSDRSLRGSTHLFGLASNPIRLRILICVVDGAKTIDQICKQLGRDRRLVNQYVQTLARGQPSPVAARGPSPGLHTDAIGRQAHSSREGVDRSHSSCDRWNGKTLNRFRLKAQGRFRRAQRSR